MADQVIVLGQRWTDRKGTTPLPSPLVEALVIMVEGNTGSVFSCFYDPNQGQTLADAGDWWHRGIDGLLPSVWLLAMPLLHRMLPHSEVVGLQALVENLCEQMNSVSDQLKKMAGTHDPRITTPAFSV